jgi:crotonobetainyl-CoA:carnitine CoA-transferase CaiB-like acyl-CoA transferase
MHSALAALVNQASAYLVDGVVPSRLGNRHPSITPYETFAAADGELVVACGNDAIFSAFAGVLGRPELATDPRFARNDDRAANREALYAELRPVLAGRTVADWVGQLRGARVPAGPVNDVAEAFAFATALGLDPVDVTGAIPTVRPPYGLSGTPAEVRLPPPALDEHGEELRLWLSRPAPPAPGGSSSAA